MRDRIRLAYTVYIGERPGSQARIRMDRNRDGALSDAEAERYGEELAADVLPNLQITADGAAQTLAWAERSIGLGTPTTRAGSFSVDLIAWICTDSSRQHSAVLIDRYRVPLPGETEVKVQKSPGIDITRSSLGADQRASQLDMTWRGNDGPMASLGLYLEYTVDPDQAAELPGACRSVVAADGSPASPKRNWPALIALLGAALAGLLGFAWTRRRERDTPAPDGG